VTQVQIRLWLRSNDLDAVLRAPTLAAISLFDGAVEPGSAAGVATALAVPPLSQMTAPEAIRSRICSPTCVSMVLGYWGHVIEPAALASEMYDGRHDVYGVWPAAIAAAARRRVHGYLLRFPSWAAVEWCLSRRLPVIASIRYTARELRGAAVEATAGHLIVLTGFDGEGVLVNDPAAPTPDEVPRSYSRSDLHRVWLERTGVGYVLFPASSRQPT
jgi:hypothetical protein